MRSALVSAHGLKNEVCYNIQILVSCLCYHGVPRSQPITLLRHFEFFILINLRTAKPATWKLVQVAGYSAVN